MKVALCTIAKMENRYIKEYVSYYKKLGVDVIYLYDNNDVDGERFEQVIDKEIHDGSVVLLDYRGRKKCQVEAYQNCYEKYGGDVDWMMFFDVDEYLTFSKESGIADIKEYLSQDRFDKYNMIHLNWMCYGDNDKVYYEEGKVIERFPVPLPLDQCIGNNIPENYTIKSIVRGGNKIKWMKISVHTPKFVQNAACCDAKGCAVDDPYLNTMPMDFSVAYLRHYSTKTAEEYAVKMKRGFPDQKVDEEFIQFLIENRFFATNKKNIEKERIIEKILDIPIYSEKSIACYNDLLYRRYRRLKRLLKLSVIALCIGLLFVLVCFCIIRA